MVVIACSLGVYLLWLLVLLLDALRALNGLTPPFRFIAAITMITIAVVLVGPFFGAYYSIPKSAPAFTTIFGLVNVYVYVLAFSYLPKLDDFAVSSNDDDGGGDDDDMGTLELSAKGLTGGDDGSGDGGGGGGEGYAGLTGDYGDDEFDDEEEA